MPDFYEKIIAEEVNVKKVEHGKELVLNKTLTPELKAEGFARELVRVIQAARKKIGLSVDDRILLSISCDTAGFDHMIKEEVLATSLSHDQNYAHDEIVEIDGQKLTISLEKAV